MLYQLRRLLILLGLCAGPIFFVAGIVLSGHLPEGVEWLETVFLVPLISIGAGGAVAGVFVVIDLVRRMLYPAPDDPQA